MHRSLRLPSFVFSSLASVFLVSPQHADAQLLPKLSTTGSAARARRPVTSQSVPGCPDQGGLLDSISVPFTMSITLDVFIGTPLDHPVSFQLLSRNPAFVSAGDKVQGFLPIVTVPAGAVDSNPFDLFGVGVGSTFLDVIPLSPGFGTASFPAGAWDVNQSGGTAPKFLDANPPAGTCRDGGSPTISQTGTVLATCGASVKGVASDGAT